MAKLIIPRSDMAPRHVMDPMGPEAALREASDRQGWDERSQRDVMLDFIERQGLSAAFHDDIERRVTEEDTLAEEHDGANGQDRESYTDDQDRDSYTPDES